MCCSYILVEEVVLHDLEKYVAIDDAQVMERGILRPRTTIECLALANQRPLYQTIQSMVEMVLQRGRSIQREARRFRTYRRICAAIHGPSSARTPPAAHVGWPWHPRIPLWRRLAAPDLPRRVASHGRAAGQGRCRRWVTPLLPVPPKLLAAPPAAVRASVRRRRGGRQRGTPPSRARDFAAPLGQAPPPRRRLRWRTAPPPARL